MTWQVFLTPSVEKTVSKLPRELIERVFNKFEAVQEAPFTHLEHFEGAGYNVCVTFVSYY